MTLAARIRDSFGCDFDVTRLFEHASVRAIATYIAGLTAEASDGFVAGPAIHGQDKAHQMHGGVADHPDYYRTSVAIIGISCHVPGAENHRAFWDNLMAGREGVERLSAAELRELGVPEQIIAHPRYVPVRATIAGKDLFDPSFFKISPKDATLMDPQLRLLLQHAWWSIEDAGYVPSDIPNTGVFASTSNSFYGAGLFASANPAGVLDNYDHYQAWLLSQSGTVPTIISYKLGLRGPSYAVHSNCSSSLIGLHTAYQSLLRGEVRHALVAAATLGGNSAGYIYQEGLNFASDGHVKTFDARADGMIGGEGVAVVLLKRAEDAIADGDHIYALIRGVAVNNDGTGKVGFYAPSVQGQAEVIGQAFAASGVDPRSIGYVEAHGTGTSLGDPIEFAALSQAFRKHTDREQFCGLGSVKSNIGHLDVAAGLAGTIKTALALQHGRIPPTINYHDASPHLDLANSPFYIADTATDFASGDQLRRAAVSSFGIGGTNSHTILEQAPEPTKIDRTTHHGPYLVPLSARSEERLKEYAASLLAFVGAAQQAGAPLNLADVAYTLQIGREAMESRIICIVQDADELRTALETYCAGHDRIEGCYRGRVEKNKGADGWSDDEVQELVAIWLRNRQLPSLAKAWAKGFSIDWGLLHGDAAPHRISLPTYPFAKERYRLGPAAKAVGAATPGDIMHPLVHRNNSGFSGLRFSTRLTGEEPFLRDHVVRGLRVLPAVVHLEMARVAVAAASGDVSSIGWWLRDVVWKSPVVVDSGVVDLHIELAVQADGEIAWEICSHASGKARIVHSRGRASPGTAVNPHDDVDIAGASAHCGEHKMEAAEFYAALAALELDYGPSYRVVTELSIGSDDAGRRQVLVRLAQPSSMAAAAGNYVLHPSYLDGALQGRSVLELAFGKTQDVASSPLSLDEVAVLSRCPARGWARIRSRSGDLASKAPRKLDIDVCDEDGRLCARLRGLVDTSLPSTMTVGAVTMPDIDPATKLQATLSQWMSELLRVPIKDFNAESDLTEYGLDSISSTQLINRLNQVYGLQLQLTIFYEYPTLREFVRYLVEQHHAAFAAKPSHSSVTPGDTEIQSEPPQSVGERPSVASHPAGLERRAAINGSKSSFIASLEQNSYDLPIVNHQPMVREHVPLALVPQARPATLPLSYAQERMLQVHQQANVGAAYNLPMAFRLIGALDMTALQASFAEVVRRHESLRTYFPKADGGPMLAIAPSLAVELPILDLQHMSDDERPREIQRLLAEVLRRSFDLEAAPLFRFSMVRLRPAEHLLVMVVHHIISDNWSMDLLIREVATLYGAFLRGLSSPLADLSNQYVDYAIWQKERVQAQLLDRELDYWIDRLRDVPELNLPTDRLRPSMPSYRGATAYFTFPEHDVAALRRLARQEGASLFMVLLAAFNVVLFRLSGQEDIAIATPVAGRRSRDVEDVIGFFINTLVLRTDLSGQPTFRELLSRVRNASLNDFAHQDLPLVRIEQEIGSVRDLARRPLFRTLISLHKVQHGGQPETSFSGLEMLPVVIENDTARRDQSFFIYETADGLFGTLEYAADLFDAPTIERMIAEFRDVLYQIIEDPGCGISTSSAPIGNGGVVPGPRSPVWGAGTSLDPADWTRFRAQGHRMFEDMVGYLEHIRRRPVWQPIPDDIRARFRESLPVDPTDLADVHDEFMQSILPFATGNSHPGFMGWVHGGGNPDAMLAEMLAAGLNANLGGRDHMPMEVEKQIVQWARELFGFPEDATGLFVTGTSMANMVALLVARNAAMGAEVRRTGVSAAGGHFTAYTSAAAHGCIPQAMDLSGIGTDALRLIPTDKHHAIDIALLERAIADDRNRGLHPFLIVGTAGTVDIGATDDLKALAAIARREGIWFHVDGAFGALGMLAPDIAPRLVGIEEADSLAFDFHKWGQVPYDAGFIMVRDGARHRAAFSFPAAYLRRETRGLAAGSPWFCDFGPDLSRGFRALKTWFTIKVHGAKQIGAVISKTCELAQYMKRQIESGYPDLELLAPVQLNIVCFRYRCDDPNPVNSAIVADLHESGIAAPSSTVLDGQIAIRAAIVNHRTEIGEIDALLRAAQKFGRARTKDHDRPEIQAQNRPHDATEREMDRPAV